MVTFKTTAKAQQKLAENLRSRRLQMGLTQEGLAERSGVALATLRKFEQKGMISLESFLKLNAIVGSLEQIITATAPKPKSYSSIDEVLKEEPAEPKRGRHK